MKVAAKPVQILTKKLSFNYLADTVVATKFRASRIFYRS